jgi:TRAP-type C4-dicarboxylate transport system substrate-binding protein
MRHIYPGVAFVNDSRWQSINADLNAGLEKLAAQLNDQRTQIEQQRRENGTEARFGNLTSRPFPGGY